MGWRSGSFHRRRRLLYSRWRRLVRWEYWPTWAFYLPVVAYILFLGLRHRGITVATAANPGFQNGGIGLVSKSAILNGLMGMPQFVADFVPIEKADPPSGKMKVMRSFMRDRGLSFPVVLKPDYGERGRSVQVVRSEAAAAAYLDVCPERVIVQEYVAGLEFGVFYARPPNAGTGRIISLTEKCPTHVTGDGRSSLEQLILDDPRAVCFARHLFEEFGDRLDEIVPAGKRVTLVELGSHCRGSLFLDAQDLVTEELESAFDQLSRSFEGFFIGRYDVRVPSREMLRQGKGFKVLELNGTLSEPTHIYDPKHGLGYAYKTMFRLWKDIFAIGAANLERGVKPLTMNAFWDLGRNYVGHLRAVRNSSNRQI